MYMFFLGVILGFGLHAAIRSVAKTVQLRRIRREVTMEETIQRRIQEHIRKLDEPWNDDGWRGPKPAGPNGRFVPMRHP